jgi:hypothetical protein
MTQTPLKRPQRPQEPGQPAAASPSDSNSSTAIELLQTALQHANQAEVADFAQLLQDHQTHQRQTAQQIAHYLRPALGGQSLAQMVLDELAGTVARPQRLAFEAESLEVPQLPDYELFRQHYERHSLPPLPAD